MRKEREKLLEEKKEKPKRQLQDEVDFERWYSSISKELLESGHTKYRYDPPAYRSVPC